MAARYVNPQNVVAQGQGFYTGLSDRDQQKAGGGSLAEGSYSGHGGGGGTNVMGRGSGGSAGVSADRTGSDSSKSWNYKPSLSIAIDVQDRREEQEKEKEKAVGELGPGDPVGKLGPGGGRVNAPHYQGRSQRGVGDDFIDADSYEVLGGLPSAEQMQLPAGGEQPALPGSVTPRQLVKETPSSRRDRTNLRARERYAENQRLRDLGAAVQGQHGPDVESGDLMRSSDAMWGMKGVAAASRDMSRPGV